MYRRIAIIIAILLAIASFIFFSLAIWADAQPMEENFFLQGIATLICSIVTGMISE